MNFQNPYLNPYGYQMPTTQPTSVVKVNGENGARAFMLGANSSALLLDESGLLVWLVVSDGAGYKTVTPYDITPHQATPTPDFGTLESRIQKLEEIVNGNTTDTFATRRRAKPDDSDDSSGKNYAWRNAESSGGINPDR